MSILRSIPVLVAGLLLLSLRATPAPGAGLPECTCVEGQACWHDLRAPVSPPDDPCSCRFCEEVTRHDGTRPWPKGWNRDCGAQRTMEGFLRRHAASWNLACSERNEPWRSSCEHPERHPFCGEKGESWNPELQTELRRLADLEKKLIGSRPVIVQSPHFYVVTDIPMLKMRTQDRRRPFRRVRTHELAHIYAERCEKAYRMYVEAFGAPRLDKPCGVYLFEDEDVAEAVRQRYLGAPRQTILHGGGSTSVSAGHCWNGFVLSLRDAAKQDEHLHVKVRHLVGHLLLSCWKRVDSTERYMPRWMLAGLAHWLSRGHPRLRDGATFCGNENLPLQASGKDWDKKARKLARDRDRAPAQVILDANTAAELDDIDMHVRIWSWFEVFLEDDPERFVAFLAKLRDAVPARKAMLETMKCDPEELDRRWAERVLGRRDSAAPTAEELDRADPSAPGTAERAAIREGGDPRRLASLIRALDRVGDVRTALTVLPLLGHETVPVREAAVSVLARTRDVSVRRLLRRVGLSHGDPWILAGVVRVVGMLRDAEARGRLKVLLGHDHWLVRANACRALAGFGEVETVGPVLTMLRRERSPKPTIAAMRTLARFPGRGGETVGEISSHMGDRDWQVRAAAVQALGALGRMASVPELIARMEAEGGRVREECREALSRILRDDLGEKPEHWRAWWDKLRKKADGGVPPRPVGPAPSSSEDSPTSSRTRDEPTYYGLRVFSRSVGFVLDVSGSMEQRFVVDPEVERRLGRAYQAQTKIGIAKEEVLPSIQSLDPRASFNVYLFSSRVRSWRRSPQPASVKNRESAIGMIRQARPEGETNYFDTFLEVLGLEADERAGSDFADTPDTIFFLTDGEPTVGTVTSTDALRSWFAEENRFAMLRCHVIAFGLKDLDLHFLTNFAKASGGTFFQLQGE